MKQRLKRRIYNWFVRSWVLSGIITVIPALILAYFQIWNPIDISKFVCFVFSAMIILSGLFTFFRYWADSIEQSKRENTDIYYQSLTDRNLGATNRFTEAIIAYISEGKNKMVFEKPMEPFSNKRSALSPIHRIEEYISNACEILAQFFDTKKTDIGFGIYVKNDSQEWCPLCQYNIGPQDQSFDKTIKNETSSFYQVANDPNKYFFMEKYAANKVVKYVPTANELENGIWGSIYCNNISLVDSNGKILRHIVLCITTYKTLVCQDSDVFAKMKAQELFSKISSEIKYEIANLVLYQHLGLSKE